MQPMLPCTTHCRQQESNDTLHTITGNLGLLTRESYALANSDTAPATFWLSSPDNVLRSNRAAGSAHTGFQFSFDEAAEGKAGMRRAGMPGMRSAVRT